MVTHVMPPMLPTPALPKVLAGDRGADLGPI
jgi:hypothetical protein